VISVVIKRFSRRKRELTEIILIESAHKWEEKDKECTFIVDIDERLFT